MAALVARPMAAVARVASPLLWVLERSSRFVLKMVGIRKSDGETVTGEEVKTMIAEGTQSGVFEPQEEELLLGGMRFGDRKIRLHEVVGVILLLALTLRLAPDGYAKAMGETGTSRA